MGAFIDFCGCHTLMGVLITFVGSNIRSFLLEARIILFGFGCNEIFSFDLKFWVFDLSFGKRVQFKLVLRLDPI